MSEKILTIYDLSGIQNFIFSTQKLQDMIGASSIVHTALFENIPKMLGKENWEEESIFSQGKNAEYNADIVYIGGGNALLIFDDRNTEKKFTRDLCKRVYEQSGGAIRLCTASINLDEEKSLSDNQKKLMEELDKNKRAAGNVHSFTGLSITAHDNNNFEPIVMENGVYDTKSQYCKKAEYNRLRRENTDKSDNNDIFSKSAMEFESFRTMGKNYLAVIHIDGNTMGVMIRKYVQSLKKPIAEAMEDFKQLSLNISSLYKDVLKETIKIIYSDSTEKVIPFRQIVADGDDITVIIESKKAFSFVEKFMEQLRCIGSEKFKKFCNFTPTAAAGIAFVKLKFPFYTAYNIAEACCKNAKKKTLERNREPKNSVDFQICYSGITGNLSSFRTENYLKNYEGRQYQLIKRPYVFEDGNEYAFTNLKKIHDELSKKEMARSKLKGLRNAYGEGYFEANTYGKYIKEHAMPGYTDIADKFAIPFDEKAEAIYFDYLDTMDIAWEEKNDDDTTKE